MCIHNIYYIYIMHGFTLSCDVVQGWIAINCYIVHCMYYGPFQEPTVIQPVYGYDWVLVALM